MRSPLELPPLIRPVLALFDKYAPSPSSANDRYGDDPVSEPYKAAAELAYKMLDVDTAGSLGVLVDFGPQPAARLKSADYGDLLELGLATMVCDKGEPYTVAATVRGWALRKWGKPPTPAPEPKPKVPPVEVPIITAPSPRAG